MLKLFFSPENAETAAGMFTPPHLIFLTLCLIFVGIAVYFSRNLSEKSITKIIRIFAIVFTAMEVIKIIYKFALGYTDKLDYFVPISFCSLFIYCLWFCGYGKGILYKTGSVFMSVGCITGGLAFLIVPATSLMMHPIYHYLSIHSMLFHSAMVYLGVLFTIRKAESVSKKTFFIFSAFIIGTSVVAVTLNLITGSNLMLLSFPVNIPVNILNYLANKLPPLYTVVASVTYVLLPYGVFAIIDLITKKFTKKNV
jgi:hypothetical protein